MIIVKPPSARALHSNAAALTKALHAYAAARPGGAGGAMLELRDEHNLPAIAIVLDQAEMNELAERVANAEQAEAAIARVMEVCHDLPYEYVAPILAALDGAGSEAPRARLGGGDAQS